MNQNPFPDYQDHFNYYYIPTIIGGLLLIIIIVVVAIIFVKKYNSNNHDNKLKIFSSTFDRDGRYFEYLLDNSELLEHKPALQSMFNTIKGLNELKQFNKKIIMVHAMNDQVEYSFHYNTLIDNDTTFSEYYEQVKDIVSIHYDKGYDVDIVETFKVRVWNIDMEVNSEIKITKDARIVNYQNNKVRGIHTQVRGVHTISRLVRESKNPKSFIALDIETMEHFGSGRQFPALIAVKSDNFENHFLIDNSLNSIEEAEDMLWKSVIDYIVDQQVNNLIDKNITIFAHNLGGFDGLFLYKYLARNFNPAQLQCLIDDQNDFITITVKIGDFKLIFKDSYRIFPVSLNELCKVFNVEGKLCEYNDDWSNMRVLENEVIMKQLTDYCIQDTTALFLALKNAQFLYIEQYKVDIVDVVSMPSLAFKIFRLRFLKDPIPILSHFNDMFIRLAYYGGSTDVYSCYAKDLHYYDVNSLYPFVMCKPMPFNLIKSYRGGDFDFDKFFGFLRVDIYCPDTLDRPVLPFRKEGKTIYPTGVWTATYFSEELRAVLPLGYKILKIHGAKEFDKKDIFSEYVNEMYQIKMNSTGAKRWISKLLQNSLYGLFGRKQELLETKTIFKSELPSYICTNIIKNVIPISEDKVTILMVSNLNFDIIKKLNIKFELDLKQYSKTVNSNVAIAAAVTAYARIHMLEYKIDPNTVYTDTDSIFTTKKLDDKYLGPELGKMKDELSGKKIAEAYFLGPKEYGYYYFDDNNVKIEKSVWAGVKRDSISFDEIVKLRNGCKITKINKARFYRSLIKLSIVIKESITTIEFKPNKVLLDNKYIPVNLKKPIIKFNLINKLSSFILKIKNFV